MDILFDYENMDVMFGENINSIERELDNTINGSVGHKYTEAFPHPRRNSSQENEIKNINNENEIPRQDKLLESMKISNEREI